MDFFRQIDRRILLLWALLLSLALLCAQGGAKLHVHDLDHGHDDHHSHHHPVDEMADHSHLSKAHFIHDTSHNDHHNGVASEIDVAPDGLLKNSNDNIFPITLFALFFTLITFVPSRWLVTYYRENKRVLHNRYLLSPPLRAPPLY